MPDDFHMGAATRRIADPPFSSRRTHHGIGNGQAEPSPFAPAVAPLEAVEEKRPLVWRDARATVLNDQADRIPVGGHDDTDPAPRPRVAAGIVDQHAAETVDPPGWRLDQHVTGPWRLTESAIPLARATGTNLCVHASTSVGRSTGSLLGLGGLESNRARNSRSSTIWRSRLPSVPMRRMVPW